MKPTIEMIQYLRDLGNGLISLKDWERECGICGLFGNEFEHLEHELPVNFYGYIEDYFLPPCFESWAKYSGHISYPIGPYEKEISLFECQARKLFWEHDDKWADHEYGDLRRELCLHIADELEKLL